MLSPCFPRFSHTFNGRSPSFTGRAERVRMVRPAVQLSPEEISQQRLQIGRPFRMGVSDAQWDNVGTIRLGLYQDAIITFGLFGEMATCGWRGECATSSRRLCLFEQHWAFPWQHTCVCDECQSERAASRHGEEKMQIHHLQLPLWSVAGAWAESQLLWL